MFENCPAKDNDTVKPNSNLNKNQIQIQIKMIQTQNKKGKFEQKERVLTSRAL